jgi:dTDP-4-amino-4,6-dideoxygalactose transaminase
MQPLIPESSKAYVNEVLDSGMLVQSKFTHKLEQFFCSFFEVEEAIMVSNGTASIHLALLALGIGKGDEVIVPSLSFIATANAVELVGAKPVFVDVCISDNNIDTTKIEAKINSNTKAILPVHEFGLMSNMPVIMDVAKRNNLKVIEDAACALGAKYNDMHSGLYGDIASFSFHPRKTLTSGEGGLIITRNKKLAETMRSLKNHGFHLEDGENKVVMPGFNYRITDIQSALLYGQLETLEEQILKKTEIAERYKATLNEEFFILPSSPSYARHSWQTFHIVLRNKQVSRDEILCLLQEEGIGCNFGAQCMPNEKYFKSKYPVDIQRDFPNSLYISQYGIALPLYYSMQKEDVDRVSNTANKIVDKLIRNAK